MDMGFRDLHESKNLVYFTILYTYISLPGTCANNSAWPFHFPLITVSHTMF